MAVDEPKTLLIVERADKRPLTLTGIIKATEFEPSVTAVIGKFRNRIPTT